MSSKHKIFSLLLILILLPVGCMVGPKYAKPEQQKVGKYSNAPINADTVATVTNLKWFDIFNDDVLKQLIKNGLENNYDLQIAYARIEQARAELGYSKSNLYPSFQYAGTINSNKKVIIPSRVGGVMSWELDFWGKTRHENKALNAEYMASEEARKVILTNLVSDIAISYFELRDLDNQLEIAKKTLQTRKKTFDIINQRFTQGYVSEVDKVQIEQQVAIAEATIPNLERQITALENTISILIGQPPQIISRGKTNQELQVSSNIPLSLPSTLLENRPDVKKAELLYMSANDRIGVAQAMRYPSFNIAAIIGFANFDVAKLFNNDSFSQNVGASVAGPIFSFGKNKRRVEVYRQIAEQYKLSYQKTFIVAVSEVEQALKDVKTYKEEWNARQKQVTAAKRNLELSNARYFEGYVSYLEVLEVERSLFDAELSLSQLSQKQLTSMVLLYKSLGGGWN